MEIKEHIPLAPFTTFRIGGPARFLAECASADDVQAALALAGEKKLPYFVLGGGSNLLVADAGYEGVVISTAGLRGVRVLRDEGQRVDVEVAAGENWDDFVAHAVKNGWWGIENLSHIPGTVGAAAVQNIGAYGQEVRHTIESVKALDTRSGEVIELANLDCCFEYRRSIFNTEDKGRYVILATVFRLAKDGSPDLRYKDLTAYFGGPPARPSLAEVRAAVIKIRDRKLPFPREAKNGSAGSFFKNPEGEWRGKLSAAALIDTAGLKNERVGGAAVNQNQPLVILNESGSATAADVIALAKNIRNKVREVHNVTLMPEPEFLGFPPGDPLA